jgi:hypothetical protein
MFTVLNDSTESDIEILTRDPPNYIRYTNQPSVDAEGEVIPGAETDATLPDSAVWTDWNTHRIDWTPRISAWYVNDIFLANKTYGIPKSPSYLTLNMVSPDPEPTYTRDSKSDTPSTCSGATAGFGAAT